IKIKTLSFFSGRTGGAAGAGVPGGPGALPVAPGWAAPSGAGAGASRRGARPANGGRAGNRPRGPEPAGRPGHKRSGGGWVPEKGGAVQGDPPATDALIRRAGAGDAAALAGLVDRYRPFVRLLVRARVGGRLRARLDSSDLVQETLLRVSRHVGQFQ